MASPRRGERFDIADIVREHRAELERQHRLTSAQKRVLTDIAQCRTAALGGLMERCTSCDYQQPVYCSCRNRHCPKCQALAQEKWIEEQRGRMLDMKHFHVVFTLPAELRPLARFAPAVIFDALLRTVGRTLLEFGRRHLDSTLGVTLVLHTWTRELEFHPHAHAIVSAGGLRRDETGFEKTADGYLFSIGNLATVCRGKLVHELWEAYRRGAFAGFDEFDDPEGFSRLINRLPKSWYAYAKPSFSKGEYVLQYLGRYTHRVAIANSRLLDVQPDVVEFKTRGGYSASLHPVEFLRRFTLHVLPAGFRKIRHYGLNASVSKREKARELLGLDAPQSVTMAWQERLQKITGRDVNQCPHCKAPLLRAAIPKLSARPLSRCRAPPQAPNAKARVS